jgi:hypothetical protein
MSLTLQTLRYFGPHLRDRSVASLRPARPVAPKVADKVTGNDSYEKRTFRRKRYNINALRDNHRKPALSKLG